MDITLNDISAAYRGDTVLRKVNWTIMPGVNTLLGEESAGKTTLLSVVAGRMPQSAGTITTKSTQDNLGRRAARFGFVPQRFSVVGGMRVGETIGYVAWITGIPHHACTRIAGLALSAVGLPGTGRARVRSLSPGQRQLLGIAGGLVNDPDVLVLDEPTAGLEIAEQTPVRDVITALGATRPVLVSVCDPQEARLLGGRVAILSGGRLVFDGKVEESGSTLARWRAGDAGPEAERAHHTAVGTLREPR
ncbi:ATP-binding cassette domain-containing protein [Amycolatopsis pigmentata]|uniref:ATP-binding cassette domain-containing protein n=1 Tax=Amycolatopsis pigmentata TaxID=450801 RepID=A0ABW5G709_9PSEU